MPISRRNWASRRPPGTGRRSQSSPSSRAPDVSRLLAGPAGLLVRPSARLDEAEAAPLQVAAHRARLGRLRRYPAERAPAPDECLAFHEPPEVGVQAPELLLNGEDAARVADRRLDIEPVADDARVAE